MSWMDPELDYHLINDVLKPHYHHCPNCYSHWECDYKCTIEPDLEDEGKQFGSHCACPSCDKQIQDEEKYKTKEFWLRYNGFIK